MKKTAAVLLLLSSILYSQIKPVAGESFTIRYNPAEKGILKDVKEIYLRYVFDYWGTRPSRNNVAEEMFMNVMAPDSGRVTEVKMINNGKEWTASIQIPEEKASFLSYYFTDGSRFDYNDKKTYAGYIYNKQMKPVRNARFSNADYLVMAGKTIKDQIKELELEIKDYPDNFIAHFAFWNKKLEDAQSIDEVLKLRDQIEGYYSRLEEKYRDNDELLNTKIRTYLQVNANLSRMVSQEFGKTESIYRELLKKLPVEKMSAQVKRVYEGLKRNEEQANFNAGIVGKDAPAFEFETIDGIKGKLSDYKGKLVLLDFWGTWCGPCVGEIPNLKKAYSKYKDKGFEIISISCDAFTSKKDKEFVKKFTEEKEMTWSQVLDNKTIHDIYKINHWPTLYLVDRDGKVIFREDVLRGEELLKTLEKAVR